MSSEKEKTEETKILIVEDELIIAENIKRDLLMMGYAVTAVVTSGEAALRQVSQNVPNLVLMDIKLKGELDGIEAAREIRKKNDIPIIFLTAFTDEKNIRQARLTEPYAYLFKPVELRDLKSNIELALYKHHTDKKLKESEARFRQLADASFEAIAIHDQGILLEANDQYFDMFGYIRKELIGKQVLPLTIAPDSIGIIRDKVYSSSLEPYEATGIRKDGTKFPLEIRARKIEYRGRKARVGIIRDITKRKKAEEELKKYRDYLEELVKDRTEELQRNEEKLKASLREKEKLLEELRASKKS